MTIQTSPANTEDFGTKEDFLNKVWSDPMYRAKLEDDPKSILADMGKKVPENMEIRVVSDTDNVKYLHIPSAPPEGEISDDDLLGVQGGTTPLCLSIAATIISTIGQTVLITIDY